MKIQYTTWLHPYTAAGVVCINVVKELVKMGVDVSINPLNPQNDPVKPQEYCPEVQEALRKGFRDDVINIFFSYPDSYPHIKCKVNVGYTGADSDLWYQSENQKRPEWFCNEFMDYMLTPSDYSRKIMYNCGVKIPIDLYPHGIDLDIFKPLKREPSIPLTIVYTGELTQRKGTQDLIKAYITAVGADCDAFQLLLRANTHMMYLESDEIRQLAGQSKNIHIHWKNEGQGDLVDYLYKGHIFTYLSKADWFGMTVLEALATGMPVIATATNGYYEFVKDMIIPVEYKLEEIGNNHPYLKGMWNVVDPTFSRLAITRTINDYKQYAEKAYDDAFKIREEFSWKAVTEKYLIPFLEDVHKKHFTPKKDVLDRLKEEFKLKKGEIMKKEKRVTIGIPTKDRGIELALLLGSLLNQTYDEWDMIIYNDCHSNLLNENKTLNSLFNLIREKGHGLKIIQGERKGPHIGGQRILENTTTEFILRLDDDVAPEPNFIEELIKVFDSYPNVGAVGPIYIDPHIPIKDQWIHESIPRQEIIEKCKIRWIGNDLFLTGWGQTNQHHDITPIPSEHLNSGFMYRRDAALEIGGYFLDLSIAGHREESDLSYRIFRQGYNLYIAPSALAWHFHPMFGGIRETLGNMHSKINWDHDEKLFLERMEKWLPKDKKFLSDSLVSVIVLTHGNHEKLRDLLKDIESYTNHSYELILINNDITQESKDDITNVVNEFESIPIRPIQLHKPLSVGEARNIGVKYSNENSKFICFVDDDARILGRYNQTTDWLDYLYNRFKEKPDVGAVSPIFTWMDELQCHCVSVACMFTSKRVWNIVGGFDPVFGNKEKGTFGFEDSDWSYRCESAGFKLLGVAGGDYPFYHHDTAKNHNYDWYKEGIKKSYELLLSKYNVIISEGENNEGKVSLLQF